MRNYLDIIYDNYEKVILINLANDTFKEIKVQENEQVKYQGLNKWFIELCNSGKICAKDKDRFLNFANTNIIKKKLKNKKFISITYEREYEDGYHWCIMEILRTDNEDEALLLVQDINDGWLSLEQQKYRGKLSAREEIQNYLKKIKNQSASCGMIMFEFNPEDKPELERIFTSYFEKVFEYDSSHVVAIIENLDANQFHKMLAKVYEDFQGQEVEIGAAWDDDEWEPKKLIIEVSTNLQMNRENIN